MIAHAIEALWTTGKLARAVLLLSRQLDHATIAGQLEEARADQLADRVADLEAQIRDWSTLSGEDDALPNLTDAGEAPIPLVLTDSAREADLQRDRADALQRALHAAEVDLANERAARQAQEARANQAVIERDAVTREADRHFRTIEALRAEIAAAHRAVHRPISLPPPVLQAPGVVAARILPRLECSICPYVASELDEEAGDPCPKCGSKLEEVDPCDACGRPARDGERTGEAEAVLLCGRCQRTAEIEEARATAGQDDTAPETKPSERQTTTKESRP